MADTSWLKSLAWVRLDEGGNDDDPADSGGRTSRGITQSECSSYVEEKLCKGGATARYQGLPKDVWKAPDWLIDEIYRNEYWLPDCPGLRLGIDYLFFDFKVNAGPHRAILTLQRAVNVKDDGRMGPVTRLAITKADPHELVTRFTMAKKAFYTHLAQTQPHDRKFLDGWLKRADRVDERARSLIPTGEAKANV